MIFTDAQSSYSILDLGYSNSLNKVLLGSQESTPELSNVFTAGIAPRNLIAGELITVLEQKAGVIFSGKTSFTDTANGYRMGLDTDGTYKQIIGGSSNSVDWNVTTANVLTVRGAISASTIDIGGADASSFHVDIDGNMWLGAATFNIATNPFAVSNAGVIRAVSGTVGGWTLSSTSLTNTSGGNTVTFSTGTNAIISGPTGTPTFTVTAAGALTSTSGTIGGWTLAATTLTGGSATLDSAGDATFGTADNVIRLSATDATYRIWVGNATAASAPFSVTQAGAVKCTNITEITVESTLDLNSVLDIDSGTGANALDSTATTSDALTITGSSLTTGDLLRVYSNSADTNIRYLLEVTNDNALATGAVNVFLQQDGGNAHVRFTGDPTNSSPTDGDLTYTGTALNFYDGTRTRDLLSLWEQIAETTLGAAATSISLASIPARTDLRVVFYCPSTSGSVVLAVRFNNDSAANYSNNITLDGGVSVVNTAQIRMEYEAVGSTKTAALLEMAIVNVTAQKKITTGQYLVETAATVNLTTFGGIWNNTTDQINRIDFLTQNAETFPIGTRISVYAKPN